MNAKVRIAEKQVALKPVWRRAVSVSCPAGSAVEPGSCSFQAAVLGQNKEYLRALRAAEMASWNALVRSTVPNGSQQNASRPQLRDQAAVARDVQAGVIALLCMVFIAIHHAEAFATLSEGLAELTQVIREIVR